MEGANIPLVSTLMASYLLWEAKEQAPQLGSTPWADEHRELMGSPVKMMTFFSIRITQNFCPGLF